MDRELVGVRLEEFLSRMTDEGVEPLSPEEYDRARQGLIILGVTERKRYLVSFARRFLDKLDTEEDFSDGKVMRWWGFIQGARFGLGVSDVGLLRGENR